ncbi:16S rRNA (guanine(966)-N(2))-methyltransferase RsmD [Erythrobacteraceae bacterium CFH 75059]|uniref:16S rRNA (guanine(966)-N(2))-methyltransferase RsmD n=1 Tax=Qipengyuania thermophila TaxID=2509361 RepID=UPI0010217F42|nr:16S rRNA (guanine(966)-N(2))-methyltransferase RsmD [Qipengyuania thermophila]TCD05407.1 16S rRNA (guanine(966)-N(2))-methyltransferase RsmD [Erythrobacteraceae bacterium CFH 75059]
MRIIAGEWRGRRLRVPDSGLTRPTASRVRETLFSMLHSELGSLEELRVADLFAGSGALGLESLSRGAASCVFVEHEAKALVCLRANIAALGADSRATVLTESATRLSRRADALDLILLDPPYDSTQGDVALHRLLRMGWLGEASIAVLEHDARRTVSIPGLQVVKTRRVGVAGLTFLRRDPNAVTV